MTEAVFFWMKVTVNNYAGLHFLLFYCDLRKQGRQAEDRKFTRVLGLVEEPQDSAPGESWSISCACTFRITESRSELIDDFSGVALHCFEQAR